MDNRRFVTFLVFFFAFTYLYTGFIVPQLFPPPPQPVAVEADPDEAAAEADADAALPANVPAADGENVKPVVEGDDKPAVHPHRKVTLGSLDPDSGFFLEAQLTSAGGAIETVQLSDPKFRELSDRTKQVTVVGANTTKDRSFTTAVDAIDKQLRKHKLKLETIDWEVVTSDAEHATFAFESPDHTLRVSKTYRLNKVPGTSEELRAAFLNTPAGFTIQVEFTVTNLSTVARSVTYEMQGPVGVVLENAEHTRKYQDIKAEFSGEDDDAVTMGARAVEKLYTAQLEKGQAAGQALTEQQIREQLKQSEAWTGVVRYIGIDVQFFAALVAPLDDRPQAERGRQKLLDRTYPVMIQQDRIDILMSDISFRMVSTPQLLGPQGDNDSVTHKYAFFVGPKRSELLDPPPLEAKQVLDYGSWFGFVARAMHAILDTFYHWGMPYVLAIVCLTALVRLCMFPISKKQAVMAAKQKALAPKLQELKLKFGDDKEKFARAQMELWRKHGVNPLGGCLPAFIQLPVFIGLYTCLNTAIDLRLSSFLWIDNLAAPDAIARMPNLPVLGSDFNLLPCISVALFLVQQKLFMPPPQDEQAAMTQKMMNMMTIVMGVMFWHVPAGLCIYFICSSLWGIAERKLLGSDKLAVEPTVVVKEPNGNEPDIPDRKPGFFGKLMAAVEEAQKQADAAKRNPDKPKRGDDGKKGPDKPNNSRNKKKGR